MGNNFPGKMVRGGAKQYHAQDLLSDLQVLGISEKDTQKLHSAFDVIDIDSSNELYLSEFCAHIHVEETGFVKRIFSVFDEDSSNFISFREFVVSLWNFLTLSNSSMVAFVFDVYDKDGSGYIDIKEAESLLKDIYGSRYEHSAHAMKLAIKLKSDVKGKINLETFTTLAKKYTAMLFPAFTLRDTIRRHILGDKFWKIYDEYRQINFNGDYCHAEWLIYTCRESQCYRGNDNIICSPDSRTGISTLNTSRPKTRLLVESLYGGVTMTYHPRCSKSKNLKSVHVKPKKKTTEHRKSESSEFSFTEKFFERVEKAKIKSPKKWRHRITPY